MMMSLKSKTYLLNKENFIQKPQIILYQHYFLCCQRIKLEYLISNEGMSGTEVKLLGSSKA